MKAQEKLKHLIREVVNLIIKFFKTHGIKDEILNIPENVKQMGLKVKIMNLAINVLTLIFAFMHKATNMLIEHRLVLLGIILFMLYRGQRILKDAFFLFGDTEREKFQHIFEDEIAFRGSQIIGKTTARVIKYDESNKLYKLMDNESMLNTIRSYLKNLWSQRIQHTFDVLELISVMVMLIVTILTNTSISQAIFIPMISIFVIISFFSSAYISLNRGNYYKKHREYNNEQDLIINDLLRVPVIVKKDLNMRINKFQETLIASNENISNFHNKINFSRLFTTILETFSQYGIIIFYLLGVKWDTINLGTIAEITAMLAIIETAFGQIRRSADTLNKHNERLIILEKEEKDMKLILEVYHNEATKNGSFKIVENIKINPFTIRYLEESENDKPFKLALKKQILINNGEVVVLYGPSGSGKSTFMNMLTERIRLEKSTNIPSTQRFLFYDEKLKFGSLSIYEELFCCEETPDLLKMQGILENLHLWSEIKSNCFDVWKWMKEKKFEKSLSNGQKQRLIIAKLLYWLDNEIDVLVLDECTSGNDAAYVVADYCGGIISKEAKNSKERINVFMNKLNEYLKEEGYNDTKLYDPSGYDQKAQTTVSDLSKVVKKLLKYQWFRDIVSKTSYTAILPDKSKQTWKNTNVFLDPTSKYYNENVLGVKTGSLSNDYNLIVLYKKHGKEFLICSLGSKSDVSRYNDVNYILKTIDESDYLRK